MGATAEDGATFTTPAGDGQATLHRRGFAAGLMGAGVALAGPAWTQVAAPQTITTPPIISPPDLPDEAQVLANLLTRMATRTQVNDQADFRFVIDTGAGRTAIARDVAEALALPPGPPVRVHAITASEIVPTVRIARLIFGRLRFQDILAPVFPRSVLGADGLLGLDVLARFELGFDLARRTVVLSPSNGGTGAFNTTTVAATRLKRSNDSRARQGRYGQLILFDAHAEGIAIEAFVDSGAQYSIGNRALQRAIGAAPQLGEIRPVVPVYGVTGQTLNAEPGRVSELEIARQKLGPTPLLFADLHAFHTLELIERPALLIGADILYRFDHVRLDFGRSRMAFSGLKRRIDAAA